MKNVGKSISSRLDEKSKSVFRILITSSDQLVRLAKNTISKILFQACLRQGKIRNPLGNIFYIEEYFRILLNMHLISSSIIFTYL